MKNGTRDSLVFVENVNFKTRDSLVVTPDFDTTTRESLVKNSLVF